MFQSRPARRMRAHFHLLSGGRFAAAHVAGFAGVVEFFGGLALLLGIFTQIVALLSALWMLSTTWLAKGKMKKKYFGGYELDITLMLAALALAMLGGGIYSLDFLLGI